MGSRRAAAIYGDHDDDAVIVYAISTLTNCSANPMQMIPSPVCFVCNVCTKASIRRSSPPFTQTQRILAMLSNNVQGMQLDNSTQK
jgi:hypothetical protein